MKPVRSIHLVGDAVWFGKADGSGYRIYSNVSAASRLRVARYCNEYLWLRFVAGDGWLAFPPRIA